MRLGIGAVILAGIISGAINPIVVKLGVREIPPITFTCLRFLFATLIFLPFYLKQKNHRLYKNDFFVISTRSLFFAANVALFSISIQYTTALMSSILYVISPIIVLFLAKIILNESLNKNKLFGLMTTLIGVVFLFYQSIEQQKILTFGTPFGNLLMLVGVICYSFYMVYSKKLTHSYTPITTTFFSFFLTTIILLLIIPFELHIRPLLLHNITVIGIISLGMAVIFSSVIMYFLIQFSIQKTNAFTGSLTLYVAPFFTALTAIPIFGEKITWELVVGGLFILFGVFHATTYLHVKKRI